jgi:hypothetical protein
MIKGTSEGVHHLTDLGPPKFTHLRGIDRLIDMRTALVMNFWDESIEVSLNQTLELTIESSHLDIRSLEFDVDAVKRGFLPPPLIVCAHAES